MTTHDYEDQFKKWDLQMEQMYAEIEKKFENMGIPEKHIRSTHLALDKLALSFGWVSDWGHLSPADEDDFLKEWSDVKSTEDQELLISNYFIEHCSYGNFKKIEDCLDNWLQNPIFNKRMSIFRDCLYALQNSTKTFNPSNLIVPVLISQTDGIIGELLERDGWIYTEIETKKGKKEKKWVSREKPTKQNSEKTGDRCFGNIIKNKRNRQGIPGGIGDLMQMNSRYEVLIEGLFQSAYHGDGLVNPAFLSRHKVLHGEDVEYGSLKNTLKLFLILDYLSEFSVSNLTEPDDSALVDFRKLSSFVLDRNKPSCLRGFSK